MGKKKTSNVQTPVAQPVQSGSSGPYGDVLSGYSQFAQTGGFSPEDLSNIRARAVSPVRAMYKNAEADVDRQRALQGGYMPGYGVLKARMAREQGSAGSEAATNAEADIAQMVQSGKLAGLQGLSGLIDRGGGGGGGDVAPEPEKKKGFWGKLGGAIKKVGQVALPIALSAIPGGAVAGKLGSGALGKVAKAALPGMATVPNVRPAKR